MFMKMSLNYVLHNTHALDALPHKSARDNILTVRQCKPGFCDTLTLQYIQKIFQQPKADADQKGSAPQHAWLAVKEKG